MNPHFPSKKQQFVANTNNSSKKTDEPIQSCHGCSMTFSSGLDLRKHIDLAHKGRQAGGTSSTATGATTALQGRLSEYHNEFDKTVVILP